MMHAILAKLKAMSVKGSHHGLPPRLLSLCDCAAACLLVCPCDTTDVVSVCCVCTFSVAVAVGL